MKVRIPAEPFGELKGLIKAYETIEEKVFHGSIDNGTVTLSWDAYGNVTVENDTIEEAE